MPFPGDTLFPGKDTYPGGLERARPRVDTNLSVPRLKFPFQIGQDGALQVEQGSEDEIAQSLEVLMSTRLGQRQDVPQLGVPDLTFVMDLNQNDIDYIRELINQWEPRADVEITLTGEGTKEQNIEIDVRS